MTESSLGCGEASEISTQTAQEPVGFIRVINRTTHSCKLITQVAELAAIFRKICNYCSPFYLTSSLVRLKLRTFTRENEKWILSS